MKRKITADEVREFLATCDKQFREAGLFIQAIKFNRTDYNTPPTILLNYEERETNPNETRK